MDTPHLLHDAIFGRDDASGEPGKARLARQVRRSLGLTLGLGCSLALVGACGADRPEPASMSTPEVIQQQLGESTLPAWFSGQGAGLMPTYDERIIVHFFNRVRMTPQNWPLVDQMGQRLVTPGQPPALYQPFMSEAGRWQANHIIERGCVCSADVVGYDPMNPETADKERFVDATCCAMGVVEGVAQCVGSPVPCTSSRATVRQERWALLNQGAGAIANENIFEVPTPLPTGIQIIQQFVTVMGNTAQLGGLATGATAPRTRALGVSQVALPVPPAQCMDRGEPPCGQDGTCRAVADNSASCDIETNPDCLGLCQGDNVGAPCKLPLQNPGNDPCDEANWPRVGRLTFATGDTIEPSPTLADGVHYQILGDTAFDATPMGQVAFAVHYYERSGEPVGTPAELKLVLRGQCQDLTQLPVTPTLADDTPAPYAGSTFKVEAPATPGCLPYVFVAKDAAGLEYTYPEYGSLQAQINAEGQVQRNDETCPIWVKTRVDLSCVTPAQECTDGQRRPCYTGRAGTQERGSCKPGQEVCQRGRWSGQCDGEVTPEPTEACGDGVDNNCNGGVDEGCEQPAPADMGTKPMPVDMSSQEDMGLVIITPGDKPADEGCGCVQVAHAQPKHAPKAALALTLLAGLVAARRRRRQASRQTSR